MSANNLDSLLTALALYAFAFGAYESMSTGDGQLVVVKGTAAPEPNAVELIRALRWSMDRRRCYSLRVALVRGQAARDGCGWVVHSVISTHRLLNAPSMEQAMRAKPEKKSSR